MKIDRLIGILSVLLQNEKTTAPELARRFEVSRRTILRDIDTLNMAGIPVFATRGYGGGISVMEGYKLSKSVLSTDELQVLSPSDNIRVDLAGFFKDSLSKKIELIKKAIRENRTVQFDYYYAKGETRREIEPYRIEFQSQAWYVFGWCLLRKDFRHFKLNRLWGLSPTERSFERRSIPEEKDDADEGSSDRRKIQIRFDKSVRFRLIEVYGLSGYEENENELLLSLDYSSKEYIIDWVLGFGDKAEVISPPDIRAQLGEVTKKMHEKYQI